ncbi:hypothetical protein [Streptomyces tsukubensis]|uniref:Uncharacterized protein n=1 Tax=Streptomyces tsukubensis TaxID=83656 RepID=A0A1V4AGJ4_9ACTN|nr:hypothetical protein [Streptomyces tsukubensis]OON82731.1 hypothetical protein B1H18_01440 [Streptomyces tsukubensis]QFR92093.1 hypothetical protein GBW32_02240 [Streptomyces tsukubensis]
MPKKTDPHGFGSFLKEVLDISKELADSVIDGMSVAERDFRKGLIKLMEPEARRQSQARQVR